MCSGYSPSMENLADLECETIERKTPTATEAEIAGLLPHVPEWQVLEVDSIKRLRRVFTFNNFNQAMALAVKIGEMADEQDHHPALLVEWGRLTVTWWTHSIKGLHKNDFIMAAKTDQLL